MNEKTIRTERKVLLVSAAGNMVIGGVGILFAIFSHSQAILLDGLFNLSYFASGLFTLKVAKMVPRGDDERFPMGYAFFEPLINGIKGVLVLGVSIMALTGPFRLFWPADETLRTAPPLPMEFLRQRPAGGWPL